MTDEPGSDIQMRDTGDRAFALAETADLEAELRSRRNARNRHFAWMALGFSPAAVIPALGLALEGNAALVAVLIMLVVLVEGWRGTIATRDMRKIELALFRLREGVADELDQDASETAFTDTRE